MGVFIADKDFFLNCDAKFFSNHKDLVRVFFLSSLLDIQRLLQLTKREVNHSPKQAAASLAFCKPNNEQRVTKPYSAKKGLYVRVNAQDKE